MQSISYDQLKKMKDTGKDFILINVLPTQQFNEAHIPDSINIPFETADFEAQVKEAAQGKSKNIITYCASAACSLSGKAAEKLKEAGFTNVQAYEGGMKEWQEKSGKRHAA